MKANSITKTALMAALGATPAIASAPPTVGDSAILAKNDSILAASEKYESMVRRAILNGGIKPVGFSGEAVGKFVGSSYLKNPDWMDLDRTEFKNSYAAIRMAMVAKPNRNMTLWSKLAFNHALLGYQNPNQATYSKWSSAQAKDQKVSDSAWVRAQQTGDLASTLSSLVYEDMAIGMGLQFGPATFNFRAGGVLWNELSPLTVWKSQPRMFGWDFLPYELEQSTAQFYDYATVKGEKAGRAAWNKKPFQGLQMESTDLPWNLYANVLFGTYEGYNKIAPWMVPVDKTTELQFTAEESGEIRTFASKATGISDNYRQVFLARLAKSDLPLGMTVGANWFQYIVDPYYPKQWNNLDSWAKYNGYDRMAVRAWAYVNPAETGDSATRRYINNYYITPMAGSVDARRTLNGGLSFHVDLGFSKVDTTWFKVGCREKGEASSVCSEYDQVDSLAKYRASMRDAAASADDWDKIGETTTGWVPAFYGDFSHPFEIPVIGQVDAQLKTLVAPKNYHAGASTVMPLDGIFPYETNMVGPGKFASSDNGTAFASNMAGANLIAKFPVGRGHARMSYAWFSQLEKGRDLIYFPWRLNGMAFNATLNSDFTRFGTGLLDDFYRAQYSTDGGSTTASSQRLLRRLGDETYAYTSNSNSESSTGVTSRRNPYAPVLGDVGGLRGDYASTYEGFVAYTINHRLRAGYTEDEYNAWLNSGARAVIANLDSAKFESSVYNQKATQSFSLDLSYDVSKLMGLKKPIFMAGYLALNSVTKGAGNGIPAVGTGDDVYLSDRMLRFEPVAQITPKFYVIGLVGQERMQSSYGLAYMDTTTGEPLSSDEEMDASSNPGALVKAPIDYTDWMFGLGFDWDISPRVGLHARLQYFTHRDDGISYEIAAAKGKNDYEAWLGTTELKMWF